MNYNRIILAGNVTRDPEMSYLPSQTALTQFGLAVNRKWKSKEGDAREEVMFCDCKSFGKTAELINQYVKKGSPLLVEGRLAFEQWEGKDGTKRSKHVVMVDAMQFLGKSDGQSDGPRESGRAAPPKAAQQDDFPPPDDDPVPF